MTDRDLAAELPAPRDDEPAELRDDIVAELRDHLECALRREQLRAGNDGIAGQAGSGNPVSDNTAFQRVLARFGDPRAVARKLWWDAMWERIMAQRFTAFMAGIAAAACVAVCLLLWQFVQDSRASQAASLAEMREFNARLLAGLQRPAPSSAPEILSEWRRFRIRMVDAESGEPVSGAIVQLKGGPPGIESDASLVSTDEGMLDFGSIAVGKYLLTISSPGMFRTTGEMLLIGPETAAERTIRVPAAASQSVERINLNSRQMLDARFRYLIRVELPYSSIDGLRWNWRAAHRWLVVSPEGRVEAVLEATTRGSAQQNGHDIQGYTFAVDSRLPSFPLNVSAVSVVEPLDEPLLRQFRQHHTFGRRCFAALTFADCSVRTELQEVTDPESGKQYQLTLPDELWVEVERAKVRAGSSPPPAGMQLATLTGYGSGFRPGTFVDVQLIFDSVIDGTERTIRIARGIEVASVQKDPFQGDSKSRGSSGNGPTMSYSLLLSDEQASFLEFAKSAPGCKWYIERTNRDELASDPSSVDPAVVERITLEIEAAKQQATDNGSASS